MPSIRLKNGKTFQSVFERTILDSALALDLVLEYSCRTGRCGVCKAKVLKGESIAIKQEEALTSHEIESGYILTCCRSAKTDLKLDIEDLGRLAEIKSKTLPCRIDSLHKLAPDVLGITLRLPPASQFEYLPGQYIDIIGKKGVRRSYSLASAPRHDGKVEVHIRRVEGGEMSAYWFDEAKVNDLLRLEGPLGTFCLRPMPVHKLIFLATGTGIAPVKAMLEDLAMNPESVADKTIHVYWGGRNPADLYWSAEIPGLNIEFVPVLSRPGADWSGRTGYVHQILLADELDLNDAVVYACGSEQMIHDARQALVSHGLNPRYFYSDAFVSSS